MPKVVDHKERRRELLLACFEIFAEQGYGKVTMRQLAQEAGVSTGSIYHYFDSKEQLFEAMFEQMTQRDIEAARAGIADETPIAERFEALRRFVVERSDDLARALLVALDYGRQQRNPEFLAERLQDYASALAEQLGLDEAAARVLMTLVLGTLTYRILAPEDVAVEEHMTMLFSVVAAPIRA